MAEVVLSSLAEAVVSHAIGRISDHLAHEAPSLSTVTSEVETLSGELKRIKSFLSSPVGHHDLSHDDRLRNWVSEIRQVANDIEDVLDIFIVKAETSFANPFRLRSLRRQIESIKRRITSIFESRGNYGIGLNVADMAPPAQEGAKLRRSYQGGDDQDVEESVVGQEVSFAALKSRVLEERKWLCAIPIVGMGGLGKTTLAKKVFNDFDVKRRFDCRAWVLMSHEFVARDVFSEILLQVGSHVNEECSEEIAEEMKRKRERLKSKEECELIRMIKSKLRGKRCVVVFDDVWRVDDMVSVIRC